MALAKYGGGIIQLSGSIAGNVFARNKMGNYVRPRTKPVNPHSSRQESARTIMSYLAELWHTSAMAAHRGNWENYAAAIGMKNRLAEAIHLTGYNHFIRSNCAQMCMGETEIVAAPTIQSLPEKDPLLVCTEEDIAGQTFTFTCDVNGWVPDNDPKFGIMIAQGQPKLASRNTFHGPWRYMDFIDAIEGAAGTGTLAASFDFVVDQKVWFLARLITVAGRLSEPWQLDPRDIVADV